MPAPLVVLNGASSSGKTTIALELQKLWPRPLVASGIDTFLQGWPGNYVTAPGEDGSPAALTSGLRIVPGLGPAPSWILEFGEDFHALMRLVHRSWEMISEGGIDQVVDHVLLDSTLREQARGTLTGAFWVGVRCDVDELVRREAARGDRHAGFASGSSVVVHQDMAYDLVVDSTATPAHLLARQIFEAVMAR